MVKWRRKCCFCVLTGFLRFTYSKADLFVIQWHNLPICVDLLILLSVSLMQILLSELWHQNSMNKTTGLCCTSVLRTMNAQVMASASRNDVRVHIWMWASLICTKADHVLPAVCCWSLGRETGSSPVLRHLCECDLCKKGCHQEPLLLQ